MGETRVFVDWAGPISNRSCDLRCGEPGSGFERRLGTRAACPVDSRCLLQTWSSHARRRSLTHPSLLRRDVFSVAALALPEVEGRTSGRSASAKFAKSAAELGGLVHALSMLEEVGRGPTTTSIVPHARVLLEFSAAVGVLMFVVLSVMYEEFYGPLGVEPEDVGLTQAVIVQRALAGVALIAASGFAFAIGVLAYHSIRYVLSLWAVKFFRKFVSRATKDLNSAETALGETVLDASVIKRAELLERWFAYFVPLSLLQMLGLAEPPTAPWKDLRPWLIVGVLLAIGALVLTFTVGLGQVRDAAKSAQGGNAVSPLTFAGIRVLDIEARACRAAWLGDAERRPAALVDDDLHFLGSASGVAVFRTSEETVRVPASLVVVSSP